MNPRNSVILSEVFPSFHCVLSLVAIIPPPHL